MREKEKEKEQEKEQGTIDWFLFFFCFRLVFFSRSLLVCLIQKEEWLSTPTPVVVRAKCDCRTLVLKRFAPDSPLHPFPVESINLTLSPHLMHGKALIHYHHHPTAPSLSDAAVLSLLSLSSTVS